MMTDHSILLIINPRAGKMSFKNSFYSVTKLFSDAGWRVETYFTQGPGDAAQKAKKCASKFTRIIAVGGDGTLNETISGLARHALPAKLGYLPCGSTNDFASTLGISPKPMEAAKQILADECIDLDLGAFNDRYFTYTASFGAFTAASYNTPQNLKNAIGHFAYILSAAKQLSDMKPIKMKVTAGDFTEEGVFLYGGVSNTTSIGGVYTLPEEDVHLGDGKMELFMVRKPQNAAGYINTLLNVAARNYDDPNIIFMHADHVIFECDSPVPYTLDGEYGNEQTKADIRCLEHAYTVNGKFA